MSELVLEPSALLLVGIPISAGTVVHEFFDAKIFRRLNLCWFIFVAMTTRHYKLTPFIR